MRTDPTIDINTVIENAKLKYVVPVLRTTAYMVKNEVVRVVLVDHVQQYKG
jgi:hypothetical protein